MRADLCGRVVKENVRSVGIDRGSDAPQVIKALGPNEVAGVVLCTDFTAHQPAIYVDRYVLFEKGCALGVGQQVENCRSCLLCEQTLLILLGTPSQQEKRKGQCGNPPTCCIWNWAGDRHPGRR